MEATNLILIKRFCNILNVDTNEVLNGGRSLALWEARYMIWMYLHYKKNMSANGIARLFNRNRSNIFRGIRVFKNNMKYDRKIRRRYESISHQIEDEAEAPSSCK